MQPRTHPRAPAGQQGTPGICFSSLGRSNNFRETITGPKTSPGTTSSPQAGTSAPNGRCDTPLKNQSNELLAGIALHPAPAAACAAVIEAAALPAMS